MSSHESDSNYVALAGLLPHAGTTPVLLAARKSEDPEQRVVVALDERDARWLYGEGRLDGWTPA
jgi:hypothetical protein